MQFFIRAIIISITVFPLASCAPGMVLTGIYELEGGNCYEVTNKLFITGVFIQEKTKLDDIYCE